LAKANPIFVKKIPVEVGCQLKTEAAATAGGAND
jgi:hypothetical protein